MRSKLREVRGTALVWTMVAMVAFTGFVSLGVDYGHACFVRTQLQSAADAAARAAATGLQTSTTTAQDDAVAVAAANTADGSAVILNTSTDVKFGTWSTSTNTFTVLHGAAISGANAVRIICRRTAAAGDPVHLFFGSPMGISTFDVTASATAAIAGSGYGIIGLNNVTMSGNAWTDSYNSSVTAYAVATAGTDGSVEGNGDIDMSGGAYIHGNATPGVGKSVSGGTVSGSTTALTTALSFPDASVGSAASSNNNSYVSAFVSNGSFNTSGSQVCTMPAGTYYFNNFTMSGSSVLDVTGPVTIYVTGSVNLSGSVNTPDNIPANLNIQVASTGSVTLSGSTTYDMEVYAPQSNVTVSGQGGLFGAVLGSTLTLSGSGGVHYDQSIMMGAGVIATVQ